MTMAWYLKTTIQLIAVAQKVIVMNKIARRWMFIVLYCDTESFGIPFQFHMWMS